MNETTLVMLALAALAVVPTAAAGPVEGAQELANCIIQGNGAEADLSDDKPAELPPGSPEPFERAYDRTFGHYRCV